MGCNTQVSEKYFYNKSNVLNNSNIVQYNLDIVVSSIKYVKYLSGRII